MISLQMPGIISVSAKGETKASVVLKGGIQADLRVVTDDQYAFALNYFTGSKEHNIALRARALKLKKLSLNEYGFSPAAEKEKSAKELGSSIKCKTEEDLYEALGLDYVEPEMREDMGEIEAAEEWHAAETGRDWRTCAARSIVTRRGATASRASRRWRKPRWISAWNISAWPTTANRSGRPTGSMKNVSASRPRRSRSSTRNSPGKVSASSSAPSATSSPTARLISTKDTLALFDYVVAAVHARSSNGLPRT